MGPASRPQPFLFIEKKKKIILLAALREVGGTDGGGVLTGGPDVFQTFRISGLGNLALQACLSLCTWGLGFCVKDFLKDVTLHISRNQCGSVTSRYVCKATHLCRAFQSEELQCLHLVLAMTTLDAEGLVSWFSS